MQLQNNCKLEDLIANSEQVFGCVKRKHLFN